MKLFIWDDNDTLCELGHGLIVVLAPDQDSALQQAMKHVSEAYRTHDPLGKVSGNIKWFNATPTQIIDITETTPISSWLCGGSS